MIIATKSKETRCTIHRSCNGHHCLIYVIVTYHHSWVQYKSAILIKYTKFYPYFDFCYVCFQISCKGRDIMLQILLVFVLYPAMMVCVIGYVKIGLMCKIYFNDGYYITATLFSQRQSSYRWPGLLFQTANFLVMT